MGSIHFMHFKTIKGINNSNLLKYHNFMKIKNFLRITPNLV